MVYVLGTILASGRGVDSASVGAEVVGDLEGNGNGLLVDSILELNLVESRDIHGDSNGELEGSRVHGAGTVLGEVRIGILGGDSASVVDVFEGVGGKATVAAVVVEITGAVDELLLRVRREVPKVDEVGRLKAANSGESPA